MDEHELVKISTAEISLVGGCQLCGYIENNKRLYVNFIQIGTKQFSTGVKLCDEHFELLKEEVNNH